MPEIARSVVDGLRRGEEGAYLTVVEQLLGPVYRFLLRLCRDGATAEDLTQETFLAAWQGIGSFRGRSKFATWVFGIAYRQYLRHRDRREVETVPLDPWRHEAVAADPAVMLMEAADRQRLRQAVSDLPVQYRETLCLVHLEGFSYREAAEVLELPIGTVKSRMNTAFALLRERLEECEVNGDELPATERVPE
jgi:RNA polymerase sigma-70 factor (ECF subfamily)